MDGYGSFDTDWSPRAYLAEYYSKVEADERRTIAFFVEAMRRCTPGTPVLLFGVGPTLHHVFLAAERASEMHLADFLPENLREIERWLASDSDAHDWRPFVRHTLRCEGNWHPQDGAVRRREAITRARITRLLAADLREASPLGGAGLPTYPTVISAYCADSATADRGEWRLFMRRLMELVAPGGTFVTAALRRSRGYLVGGRWFPSAGVDERDLSEAVEECFDRREVTVEVDELGREAAKGYSSIVLARAYRRRGVSAAVAA
jgi:hypothetical protein